MGVAFYQHSFQQPEPKTIDWQILKYMENYVHLMPTTLTAQYLMRL
jgi:hypothetical protein